VPGPSPPQGTSTSAAKTAPPDGAADAHAAQRTEREHGADREARHALQEGAHGQRHGEHARRRRRPRLGAPLSETSGVEQEPPATTPTGCAARKAPRKNSSARKTGSEAAGGQGHQHRRHSRGERGQARADRPRPPAAEQRQ
jgi:hypothetical protein